MSWQNKLWALPVFPSKEIFSLPVIFPKDLLDLFSLGGDRSLAYVIVPPLPPFLYPRSSKFCQLLVNHRIYILEQSSCTFLPPCQVKFIVQTTRTSINNCPMMIMKDPRNIREHNVPSLYFDQISRFIECFRRTR